MQVGSWQETTQDKNEPIQPLGKYFFSFYYVPVSVLCVRDTGVNKSRWIPLLW